MGIEDKVGGRLKQAAGSLSGKEALRREGQEDERRAEAKRELEREREEAARKQESVERKAEEVERLEREEEGDPATRAEGDPGARTEAERP